MVAALSFEASDGTLDQNAECEDDACKSQMNCFGCDKEHAFCTMYSKSKEKKNVGQSLV